MFFTIKLWTYAKLFKIELFICIKLDLALNNLQRFIYHKTQTNKQGSKQDNSSVTVTRDTN